MNIESQVCALEYAKRLAELGVKRQTLFYHLKLAEKDTFDILFYPQVIKFYDERKEIKGDELYSAFTVSELGEILPKSLWTPSREDLMHSRPANRLGFWCVVYNTKIWTEENSEANARAKMLIYLIENKLIEV